jgi:hypothetical protein
VPQDSFIDQFTEYSRAGKEAIDLLRAAAGLLPKNDRPKAEAEIERAERAARWRA